jgi:hypothetical protein
MKNKRLLFITEPRLTKAAVIYYQRTDLKISDPGL